MHSCVSNFTLVYIEHFSGMGVFHFHGHFHSWKTQYKPKGLELEERVNGTRIFLLEIRFGILDCPLRNPVFSGNFPFENCLLHRLFLGIINEDESESMETS